jgi:hypothetical protein
MKNIEKIGLKDIDKIKQFLISLGFECNSFPTSDHQVYSKNEEVVIIKCKNNKKK